MLKFYVCNICGNLIEMIEDTGIVPNCCGEDMEELLPGTTDGAKEKHLPVCIESAGSTECAADPSCCRTITVKVGSEPHPMTQNHSIEWIIVWTNEGIYRKNLKHAEIAQADFCLKKDEKIKAIYSYCNLHGLWLTVI